MAMVMVMAMAMAMGIIAIHKQRYQRHGISNVLCHVVL